MDLSLFFRVLRRHRVIVAAGVGLAVVLAGLSWARPALDGGKPVLKFREQEEWQSQARVFVTLPGFSAGSTLIGSKATLADSIQRAEARLAGAAVLYADFATGDEVTKIVRRAGPIRGKVMVNVATVGPNAYALPIVEITAVAPSGVGSQNLANRYARALKLYVSDQQSVNEVPPIERVALRLLNTGGKAQLVKPRPVTVPIIVFLAILSAMVGLVFVFENLTRRASDVEIEAPVVGIEQRSGPHTKRRWDPGVEIDAPVVGVEQLSDPQTARRSAR